MDKIAQQLNALRVIPRLLILGYSWLVYEVSFWFMALIAPTNTQAAFVSTLVGVSAALFGLYANSGNKND